MRLRGPAAAAACILAVSGCSARGAATEQSPDTARAEVAAENLLRSLEVTRRPRGTLGYERSSFGTAWADVDGNGCNQRDDVLLRDAVPGTVTVGVQGPCDHDVLAGRWRDPYTGQLLSFTDLKDLRQAQAIQIDHVVPLAEAWVSGARSWSADRRERYANAPSVLLAVDGPANQSKGASDPAAWRPRKAYQCDYAARWIRIKSAWDLEVDPSEVRALEDMLATC